MIITTDEKILRAPSLNVEPHEVSGLIDWLDSSLNAYNKSASVKGIGLSAPQVNVHKKAAIVRLSKDYCVDLINAKIDKKYDPFLFQEEGCLSFPNKVATTKRYNEIFVVDNLVYPYSFTATGLFAVVIQHELDHLNGILLPDNEIKPILKQKPNEPCACGSGKKFKKCCYIV